MRSQGFIGSVSPCFWIAHQAPLKSFEVELNENLGASALVAAGGEFRVISGAVWSTSIGQAAVVVELRLGS